MAFVLLLPKHPFSLNMVQSIRSIAGMFPQVTIVFGSGYEFKEMCSQYGVRSFPKLLMFSDGHLYDKYVGIVNPLALVEAFAKWTKSYPQAFPAKLTTRDSPKTSSLFSNIRYLIDHIYEIFISEKTSVEPIMGSIDSLSKWDSNGSLLAISGIYVAIRIFFAFDGSFV
jgi:hypothetical protein